MSIATFNWIDRSGAVQLTFQLDGSGNVATHLYQKTIEGRFEQQPVTITGRDVVVETENMSALMRGIPQRSFLLINLSYAQKAAVLNSLQNRQIEIERSAPNRAKIVIHALP